LRDVLAGFRCAILLRVIGNGFLTQLAIRLSILATLLGGIAQTPLRASVLPYEPDRDRAEAVALQGATWSQKTETHRILLREVDAGERLRFIESRTGHSIDPFAEPPGQQPRFLSYLLVIENLGDAAFGFNALDCWLKTNRQEILTPIGLTDLAFDYQLSGRPLPQAYERVSTVMLEGARTIEPGDSLSGLLVYHIVNKRTKRFFVEVDLIPPSGDVIRFRAPYRRRRDDGDAKAPSNPLPAEEEQR
jgi:hypothetical protein